MIPAIAGEPSGELGKAAVGAYWAKALSMLPDLRFELVNVLGGVNSVVLYYEGHRGMSAEVLLFGSSRRVRAAYAHYAYSP